MAEELLKYVEDNPENVLDDVKKEYAQISGKDANEADPEMLLLKTFGYRESILREGLNHTGRQNLLRYASGQALEEMGYIFDVYRLPSTAATVTLQYFVVSGHPGVFIPKDNRVQSADGKVIFKTKEDLSIPIGDISGEVIAEATVTGNTANNYDIGQITTVLDPIAYLDTVGNTDLSAGGADDENDEQLRTRIRLVRSTFSVAGPTDAYEYFARSAHPKIVDVRPVNSNPGEVTLYALLEGGVYPSAPILQSIEDICSNTKVRPLTDTVIAAAPTSVPYNIDAQLILKKGAIGSLELQKANEALEAFKEQRLNRLGIDVIREELIAILKTERVYKPIIVSPASDIIALPNQHPLIGTINITITGTSDE
jgi:phage-related baseplate assembly protein